MQKQILQKLINIDKVAYKEVNFKSKLLEWSQKNRVRLEFKQVEQTKDENSSPVFVYQVILEGVEGCAGKGYSKKESQQNACKDTLQRLRREPQFIDSVFAAKTERTKMEEEPILSVPDPEADQRDFIVEQPQTTERDFPRPQKSLQKNVSDNDNQSADRHDMDFSLDDITATPRAKSREEIIAEAEEAAFAE